MSGGYPWGRINGGEHPMDDEWWRFRMWLAQEGHPGLLAKAVLSLDSMPPEVRAYVAAVLCPESRKPGPKPRVDEEERCRAVWAFVVLRVQGKSEAIAVDHIANRFDLSAQHVRVEIIGPAKRMRAQVTSPAWRARFEEWTRADPALRGDPPDIPTQGLKAWMRMPPQDRAELVEDILRSDPKIRELLA